jgi:hypothetical protein
MSKYQSCFAPFLFILMLSLPSVSQAYGVKHAASGGDVRWRGHNVTLRLDPALEQMLNAGEIRSAVVMASEAWRGFGKTPDITIEAGKPPAYDPSNRGNGIYLLPKWPFDSRQLAVTVVTFSSEGEVLGVDVLVNGEKPFALFTEGQQAMYTERYDIAAVLTHEFGHVLGLDESYEHPEATMYPQIRQGETHQRMISADDQQGVMEIYSTEMAPPKVGCAVSAPGSSQSGTLVGMLVGVAGLFGARSRRRAR